MPDDSNSAGGSGQPLAYQIRIKGQLSPEWTHWFGGLAVTLDDNGDTLLTGPVLDQSALHGLLRTVRDLGMPLIAVHPIQPDPPVAVARERKQ
ncbi:MAG TPA: hypothetical protein VKV73_18345 [Chloroflexota bacterium]|nr:hypothetical protein [Chloroflexota bacterium]